MASVDERIQRLLKILYFGHIILAWILYKKFVLPACNVLGSIKAASYAADGMRFRFCVKVSSLNEKEIYNAQNKRIYANRAFGGNRRYRVIACDVDTGTATG
jgi:hypothetical protein